MELIRVTETWQQALVFEIRKKTFIEGQGIPQELEFDESYGEMYHYVLLANEGQGIGTARIKFTGQGFGKIERVAIIPEYQRQGLGRLLINACEEWLLDAGINKAVITSQVKAVGFYERLGYEIDSSVGIDSVIPTVYTTKKLAEKTYIPTEE